MIHDLIEEAEAERGVSAMNGRGCCDGEGASSPLQAASVGA
jgi:hypothetical protein